MVAPLVAGALIGGGSALLGGLLGSRSQRKQAAHAEDVQREFAQSGIQWRVEDAKKAGLHPLFALGASTTGPSIPVMADPMGEALGRAGQDVAASIRAQETPSQKEAAQTALAVARSQISRNEAEAWYFESQAMRNMLNDNARPGMPAAVTDPNVFASPRLPASLAGSAADQVKVNPAESTSYASNDPSVAAARDVMWKQFRIGTNKDGSPRLVYLPNANSVSEALESVSESTALQWLVYRENMNRNPNFFEENKHLIPGGEAISVLRNSNALEAFWDKLTDPDRYRWSGPVHSTRKKSEIYRPAGGRALGH